MNPASLIARPAGLAAVTEVAVHAAAGAAASAETLARPALAASIEAALPLGLAGPLRQAREAPHLLVTHADPVEKLSISVRHIRDAARERGFSVTVARAEDVHVRDGALFHGESPIGPIDGVIVRGGADNSDAALESLRRIEATGVRMTNSAETIARVGDKGATAATLHPLGIPHPASSTIRPGAPHEVHVQVANAIDQLGNGPLVLKPISGKGGAGVMFLDSTSVVGLRSIVDTVMPQTAGKGFLAQKWLQEGTGRDFRAFISTIDDELEAGAIGLERNAAEGQGAANVANGGTSSYVELPPELRSMALRAAEGLGVRFGAVDFIMGPDGWQVVEANTSPGTSAKLAQKLGFDQAEALIDYAAGIPARR